VERARTRDEKWKNPTKIMKRIEPREMKLAVLKTLSSSEWNAAVVADTDEDIEIDDRELMDEAVLIKVEDNPDRAEKKQQRDPKRGI
jgi:hypothetical protein